MPPRSHRPANRYTVLSSDAAEPDEPDNADSTLPPSDPPEPDSGSNSGSESGMQTPVPHLPALLPFLRAAVDAVSPLSSSPWQRGRRIHRAPPSEPASPPRRSSEPPIESPRVIVQDPEEHVTSDDIMWTPRREKQILTQRAQLKRQETLAAIKAQKETQVATEAEAERVRLEREELARLEARNAMFDRFLKEMQTENASVADFMDYVFNPDNKFDTDWRWGGFFLQRSLVERIFGYWTTSKYNTSTRAFIDDWAKQHVAKKVYTEAGSITNSGILSKAKKIVNEQFFLGFNLAQLTDTLRTMAPFAFAIFDAFSTTTRQLNQATTAFLRKKEIVCSILF
ncbi:hypothetical protein B0H13DRAFT_1892776 [Mycena leptocephala]|nr:hypothetical protein B0H13DRAFT_1892776 [Mycena leptocephala]